MSGLWFPGKRGGRESKLSSTDDVATSSSEATTATLTEILSTYDLVEVVENEGEPFVVVSERAKPSKTNGETVKFADPVTFSLGELGSTVPSPFSSWARQEYNAELRGLQGLEKDDHMRRGDGTVRGTLRLIKTPVLAGRWFIEPASDKKVDVTAAEFTWKCFTEYMSITWPQVLTETLLMCDFGYYMFEKVWEIRIIDGKVRAVWKKLAPRHPMDVVKWRLDPNGGPEAVEMSSPDPYDPEPIIIPIEKLVVFTFDKEAGNIEGMSVLRSAYKHWYYKEQLYKIDAIQKERHGIGVPVIKLPPNFTQKDRTEADQLGRNLRTNERAHVVLPPNWELLFAKLEGQPVDALKSIDHHDKEIQKNVLVAFMDGGAKDEDQVMFLKATRFIANIVCDVFNTYCIPQLIDYNFVRAGYPKLRVRRIGEQADWRTLSFAIRNLIGANVIRPDDKLEEHFREEMDLPKVDEATIRETATPQAPGATPAPPGGARVGPPRQTPKPPVGPPAKQAGVDQSGGK